jgi:DNA-binding NtrC family response regulator
LTKKECAITPDALEALVGYAWPGNVRQLKMAMQHLAGLAINKIIQLGNVQYILDNADGKGSIKDQGPSYLTYKEFKSQVLGAFEKDYFQSLMSSCSGNMTRAAQKAGMDRKNFYEKLKLLKIATGKTC